MASLCLSSSWREKGMNHRKKTLSSSSFKLISSCGSELLHASEGSLKTSLFIFGFCSWEKLGTEDLAYFSLVHPGTHRAGSESQWPLQFQLGNLSPTRGEASKDESLLFYTGEHEDTETARKVQDPVNCDETHPLLTCWELALLFWGEIVRGNLICLVQETCDIRAI